MAKSILDFMTPEDRQKTIERGQKRMEKTKTKSHDVSPEMYLIAEMGYYFGWDAILAVKRGYIENLNAKNEIVKETFTLEEMNALVEAARKVWRTKLYEQSYGTAVASSSKYASNPKDAFNKGMKPLTD